MVSWDRTVTFFVPLMMAGWTPLTIAAFRWLPAHRAVLVSSIGGFLFLPVAMFSMPVLPDLGKQEVIAISILLGSMFSRDSLPGSPKWSRFDLPMGLWCFVVPVMTSMSNGLGLYDGLSGVITNILRWGILYWAGRTYFADPEKLNDVCTGIVIGGLIYVPLILFELRMAPTLSQRIYGFLPHSWWQHVRYGGYRPMVFMPHGLMVSLWMASASAVSYWLWRTGRTARILRIPIFWVTAILFATTVLAKSANGVVFLVLSVLAFALYKRRLFAPLLYLGVLIIPVYMFLRLSGTLTSGVIENLAASVFNDERVASLGVRLRQEDLFGAKALQRSIWGWGGYRRGWPRSVLTGNLTVQAVDAWWIIITSTYGLVGLFAVFYTLLAGPWYAFRVAVRDRVRARTLNIAPSRHDAAILALMLLIFAVDLLVNAPAAPVYTIAAAALIGQHVRHKPTMRRLYWRAPDSTPAHLSGD